MDTNTLVEERERQERIDDGKTFIDRLVQNKIPVAAACWVKPVDEDRWTLCIATPLVDEQGATLRANGEVLRVLRNVSPTWITTSDVKLVGVEDQITKDLLDIRRRHTGRTLRWYRGPRIGNIAVEDAYIYPVDRYEEVWPRLGVVVACRREDNSNRWKARTVIEKVYGGIDPKGAVSYTTAFWEGEKPSDAHHAHVNVLVEFDREHETSALSSGSELHCMLIDQANALADELFKRHHPEAVVAHEEREVASFA
ncbi:MAG: hypothetical protein ACP5XB_27985 [Isosphaeraceae bacterium]